MKPFIRSFQQRHRALEVAAATVDAARSVRDVALAAVGTADEALDRQVDLLANQLIGAELGPRKNAFAPFGEIPPARLKELGYALEIERVLGLVAAVKNARPPTALQRALTACTAAATAAQKTLDALAAPQAAYTAALGVRDALLPDWTRALERLRLHARAAWVDEPGIYRAIFAPPGIAAPRARRRRARARPPAPETTPPAPAGAPPVTPGASA